MDRSKLNARFPVAIGLLAIGVLVGGLGAWSVNTEISGAVVTQGVFQVQNQRQVIQHPDGGVVGEIVARNGDAVEAGDVLVRLDGTFLRTELAVIERQLLELLARRSRLVAERDGHDALELSEQLDFVTIDHKTAREQLAGEENLLRVRLVSLKQATRLLGEQAQQIEQQIEGIRAQLVALERQLELISSESADVRVLLDKGLVQTTRFTALQREEARLQGEIGRLTSLIAESQTRISQLDIEVLRLSDDRREEAITRLRDLQFTEIELLERRLSLIERLGRLDVRSPVSGTVFGSTVFARQAVVRSAEPMMYVIPSDQPLEITARIDPVDVDQIYIGQEATLVFSAFNRRTTPEIPGRISRLSPDAAMDESTGQSYYEAIVQPDKLVVEALEDIELLPGMPVETYIKTDERTPLSYLLQPLTVYFQRAFREE